MMVWLLVKGGLNYEFEILWIFRFLQFSNTEKFQICMYLCNVFMVASFKGLQKRNNFWVIKVLETIARIKYLKLLKIIAFENNQVGILIYFLQSSMYLFFLWGGKVPRQIMMMTLANWQLFYTDFKWLSIIFFCIICELCSQIIHLLIKKCSIWSITDAT